ncbi:hypothetical protein SPHINGOR109_50193 [Sphingorhabdus sp. 109]|nr:hypothetical protein SPHINGOR109_50193 [Sphingorhabdus sp. 109]
MSCPLDRASYRRFLSKYVHTARIAAFDRPDQHRFRYPADEGVKTFSHYCNQAARISSTGPAAQISTLILQDSALGHLIFELPDNITR